MAESCWIKFSFIQKTSLQVQNISKEGEFSKEVLLPLDQKSFQELIVKASRIVNAVIALITSKPDRLAEIYSSQTKATHC